jgi:hypothetical protein
LDWPDHPRKLYSYVSEEHYGWRGEAGAGLLPPLVARPGEGRALVPLRRCHRFPLLMILLILRLPPLTLLIPSQEEDQRIWVVWGCHQLREQVLETMDEVGGHQSQEGVP